MNFPPLRSNSGFGVRADEVAEQHESTRRINKNLIDYKPHIEPNVKEKPAGNHWRTRESGHNLIGASTLAEWKGC